MSNKDQTTQDKNDHPAGSQSTSEPVFLVAGRLHRTHGVKGEIEFEAVTDFPGRIRKGLTVYLGDEHRPLKIVDRRPKGQQLLLTFEGYENREEAAQLRNQWVYTHSAGLPDLPEGEYYHHQLIGMRVVGPDNQELGRLEEILETGANDVYVVLTLEGKELLIPAVEDVIVNVDLGQGVMVVKPPAWE